MAQQHRRLPAPVAEILPRQRAGAVARPVAHGERGVEPHGPAALPQPPVEFVVLVADQPLVEAACGLQRLAAERAEEDRVGRPLRPPGAVARPARPQRRGHRERRRAPEERGPHRQLEAADVGRAGALQRLGGAPQVARRQHRVGVAAHDHAAGCRGDGGVQPGRRAAPRIRHDAHRGEAPPHHRGRLRRVRAVGDDRLERAGVVLREHRFERRGERVILVARGDHDREIGPGGRPGAACARGRRRGGHGAPAPRAYAGADSAGSPWAGGAPSSARISGPTSGAAPSTAERSAPPQ